jgi:hypothetical protein
MTYMWTDPRVARAVVDNRRLVLPRRRVDKPPRRVLTPATRVGLSGIPAARPTEARGG